MDLRVIEVNEEMSNEHFSEYAGTLLTFSETITESQRLSIPRTILDAYAVITNTMKLVQARLGPMPQLNVKSFLKYALDSPESFTDRADCVFKNLIETLEKPCNRDHLLKIVALGNNNELDTSKWQEHKTEARNEFMNVGACLIPWGKEGAERGNSGRKPYCGRQFSVFLYACQCAILDGEIPLKYFELFKFPSPGKEQRQDAVKYNNYRLTQFSWVDNVLVIALRDILKQLSQKLMCELALIRMIQEEKPKDPVNKKFRNEIMSKPDFDYNFESWGPAMKFFNSLEESRQQEILEKKKWKVTATRAYFKRSSSLHSRLLSLCGMVLFKDILDFYSLWGVDPVIPDKQGDESLGSRAILMHYLK